jgi:hypothetical protein
MAVTSKELRGTAGARGVRRPLIGTNPIGMSLPVYLATGVLALLALYMLLSSFAGIGRSWLDDWKYGYPRSSHLSGFVGHEETDGSPTHLFAYNIDRQVLIIEIPGGNRSKVRAIEGPYLFGAGEDKTPVLMSLEDINGDSHKDLVVRIKNEKMIYINKDGQFQLITPEQRRDIVQGAAR